jgi:hypothetical protein
MLPYFGWVKTGSPSPELDRSGNLRMLCLKGSKLKESHIPSPRHSGGALGPESSFSLIHWAQKSWIPAKKPPE